MGRILSFLSTVSLLSDSNLQKISIKLDCDFLIKKFFKQ